MKKLIILILSLSILASITTGCGGPEPVEISSRNIMKRTDKAQYLNLQIKGNIKIKDLEPLLLDELVEAKEDAVPHYVGFISDNYLIKVKMTDTFEDYVVYSKEDEYLKKDTEELGHFLEDLAEDLKEE